ncbi:class I SAM-dependent methyltransferase [Methanosarcina horonobensis]|nr:class I SAM-dependent methyltransferase [Methanosarcina horonobensis]
MDSDKKTEGRVKFKLGNASDLPFQESSFDVAVMQAFF